MPYIPRRVFFEEKALDYALGQRLWKTFTAHPRVEVRVLPNRPRVPGTPGLSPAESYQEAKQTVLVGIRKTLALQKCKPSADFQLPLVTGCIGQCEYCYLNTRFGKNPYQRIYVNLEDILNEASDCIERRKPAPTVFEGAAASDPVPFEPYTGALAAAVDFFAQQEYGLFRFVTKYTDIDTLLDLDHQEKTTVRFSINTEAIIKNYEHFTPSLGNRLKAAARIQKAGYPLGFIIGPVILENDWEQEYRHMLTNLRNHLSSFKEERLSFEVISHRFTARAKNTILQVHPQTTLPMDEETRQYKYGQFGYGKYVYPAEKITALNMFFTHEIQVLFPRAKIAYVI